MAESSHIGPAFAGLPNGIRDQLFRMTIPCRFKRNQAVFRAGDPADGLYFVLSGRIRVSRATTRHVEFLHVETDGGVLGEIPVFGGGSFPATAIATEATTCLKLPKPAVDQLLSRHPEFAQYAIRRLATRAQSLLRRIDELTASTITGRVAGYVLGRADSGESFTLGMSQAALAEEIGTAREVVVRAIGSLIRAQAIRRVGRSRFVLVSRSRLRAIAGRNPRIVATRCPRRTAPGSA